MFIASLQAVAQRKPITVPINVTLDPATWLMLETKAKAVRRTLDDIISETVDGAASVDGPDGYADYINCGHVAKVHAKNGDRRIFKNPPALESKTFNRFAAAIRRASAKAIAVPGH